MTVEYLAYQLIDGYGKDELVTSFLDDYDFYLIPFVNPDGQITLLTPNSQRTNPDLPYRICLHSDSRSLVA